MLKVATNGTTTLH